MSIEEELEKQRTRPPTRKCSGEVAGTSGDIVLRERKIASWALEPEGDHARGADSTPVRGFIVPAQVRNFAELFDDSCLEALSRD